LIIKGGTIITVDSADRVLRADLVISGGRIARIVEGGLEPQPEGAEVIDASGRAVLPGFVQTHVHLCQTIMRGYGDDLGLLDWLRERIWPMEAAHTPESIYASARLGIAELMLGGTTAALTMETVRHTRQVLRAVQESGFRAVVGKCMMDQGRGVPAELVERTDESLEESLALFEEWHGRDHGRIRCCLAPRFALSCSPKLLKEVARLSSEHGLIIHTHASESREEVQAVRQQTGRDNIEYLDAMGLLGPRTVLAHCVWATDGEIELICSRGASVAHCPSSNLKLGSGIARVAEMMERGVRVSLGADGAPCNNRLDMFTEMRAAGLLQKIRLGPGAMPANRLLRMATIEGARALGLDGEIGSIEEGKLADLVILRLDRPHLVPRPDLISTIVYSAEASDVETVMIEGNVVVRGGRLLAMDQQEVLEAAARESRLLAARAGIKS
jgi:5-methylthioadenosine/S-adenosylhomocysteine deaminase